MGKDKEGRGEEEVTLKAFIIAEGEHHDTIEYETPEQLEWFKKGVDAGSGAYGSGSCVVLTEEDLQGDTLTSEYGFPADKADYLRKWIRARAYK